MPVQPALPTPQPGTAGTGWHLAKKIGKPAKKEKKKKDNKEDSLPRPRLLFPGEQGADSGRFRGRRLGRTSPALCGAGGAESRVCSAAFSRAGVGGSGQGNTPQHPRGSAG